MPGFLLRGMFALAFVAFSLNAAPLLYSLGTTDGMLYSLTSFDMRGNETPLFGVGLGFNGGLTYDPAANLFYAISNDMEGNSTLNSVSWEGSVRNVLPLGRGFYGGLTNAGSEGQFYAIGADRTGVQNNLFTIDLPNGTVSHVAILGDGNTWFDGGIAYSPSLIGSVVVSMIGMQFTDEGVPTSLYTYSPLTGRFGLDGIYRSVVFPAAGGLALDERGTAWWALGIDPNTGQQLLASFDSSGIIHEFGLNSFYSGLVLAERSGSPPPPPGEVPEPGSLLLITAGLAAVAIAKRSHR